jgi:hypothetical protein
MAWPYSFVSLTEDQKQLRREAISRYGVYAQLSALVPILVFQLYRLWAWVYSERQRSGLSYSEVPTSPSVKRNKAKTSGLVLRKWRAMKWWMGEETLEGWGERWQWIGGALWTTWLLFLCLHGVGVGECFYIWIHVLKHNCFLFLPLLGYNYH